MILGERTRVRPHCLVWYVYGQTWRWSRKRGRGRGRPGPAQIPLVEAVMCPLPSHKKLEGRVF
jgi:hypothetical protein